MFKRFLLIAVLAISFALSSKVARAEQHNIHSYAYIVTDGIYASCGNGAKAGFSASGIVRVRFYRYSGGYYEFYSDFGYGMSKYVYSNYANSYSYAEAYASNNSIIGAMDARCK